MSTDNPRTRRLTREALGTENERGLSAARTCRTIAMIAGILVAIAFSGSRLPERTEVFVPVKHARAVAPATAVATPATVSSTDRASSQQTGNSVDMTF